MSYEEGLVAFLVIVGLINIAYLSKIVDKE